MTPCDDGTIIGEHRSPRLIPHVCELMLEINAALALVLEPSNPLATERVSLTDALGRVLAEDIASDVDSPPHDQSSVDGFAIVGDDLKTGAAEFEVIEEITAGIVPTRHVSSGKASAIMTGAPVPPGATAVVMVERSEALTSPAGARRIRLRDDRVAAGQNIRRQAASMRRGDVVLCSGKELRPIELGLLAEVGQTMPAVIRRPRVAVLSTGNELVAADEKPAAGQIRNSNSTLLSALVKRGGGHVEPLGIGRDNEAELAAHCARGLEADVLLISGGVSAGVLDLVPQVLASLGVRQVFHKVRIKPGQPLWFGVRPGTDSAGQARSTLVFGLPGNPVSGLVCFEVFVRPALARLQGRADDSLRPVPATLTRSHKQRGTRPTYWPARLETSAGQNTVEPLPWQGSGDLRTLAGANALAFFPAEEREFAVGEEVTAYLL